MFPVVAQDDLFFFRPGNLRESVRVPPYISLFWLRCLHVRKSHLVQILQVATGFPTVVYILSLLKRTLNFSLTGMTPCLDCYRWRRIFVKSLWEGSIYLYNILFLPLFTGSNIYFKKRSMRESLLASRPCCYT